MPVDMVDVVGMAVHVVGMAVAVVGMAVAVVLVTLRAFRVRMRRLTGVVVVMNDVLVLPAPLAGLLVKIWKRRIAVVRFHFIVALAGRDNVGR